MDQTYFINYSSYHGACDNEKITPDSFDNCIHCNSVVFCCMPKSQVQIGDLQLIENKTAISIYNCRDTLPNISFNKNRRKRLKAANIIKKLRVAKEEYDNSTNHANLITNKYYIPEYDEKTSGVKNSVYENDKTKNYILNEESKINSEFVNDDFTSGQICLNYAPDIIDNKEDKSIEPRISDSTTLEFKEISSKKINNFHIEHLKMQVSMNDYSPCSLNSHSHSEGNDSEEVEIEQIKSKCAFKKLMILIILFITILTGISVIIGVLYSKTS